MPRISPGSVNYAHLYKLTAQAVYAIVNAAYYRMSLSDVQRVLDLLGYVCDVSIVHKILKELTEEGVLEGSVAQGWSIPAGYYGHPNAKRKHH